MIRPCVKEDFEWLIEIAVECYPEFDIQSSRSWLQAALGNEGMFVVRGDESAALAMISKPFYMLYPIFTIQFVVSRKTRFGAGEVLNIIKYLNDLRKSKGYDKTWISSSLADLGPFIRKLGGKIGSTSWILED